jgi:hypothetical protein
MKDTGTSDGRRAAVGAGLLACAITAAACAPKAARRQTESMEKTGAVSVSAVALRARVDDLAERLAGRIEETCDRIRREARDPVVRRRALTAKIEAIPALFTAAYRVDPFAAALDVWALAFQLSQFVEGEGRDYFGPQQPLLGALARDVLADADAVVRGIAIGPDAYARARAKVEDWARAHPIERNFTARPSLASSMAELRSERDAFVAVGAATETLENVSQRLNTYAAQLPKQARWQAELLAEDMTIEPAVAGALGDVHEIGEAARRASALMDQTPGLVAAASSPLREMVVAERRAVLAAVDGQRVQTLQFATAERLAVLAALREERIATLAALRGERVEILKELDAIKSRGVDSAVVGLEQVVDYALWRVAGVLALLIALGAVLFVVAHRLTRGRRDGAPA